MTDQRQAFAVFRQGSDSARLQPLSPQSSCCSVPNLLALPSNGISSHPSSVRGVTIALGLNHPSTLNCSRNCPSLPITSVKSTWPSRWWMIQLPTPILEPASLVQYFPDCPQQDTEMEAWVRGFTGVGRCCQHLRLAGSEGCRTGSRRRRSSKKVTVTETSASPVVL